MNLTHQRAHSIVAEENYRIPRRVSLNLHGIQTGLSKEREEFDRTKRIYGDNIKIDLRKIVCGVKSSNEFPT